MVYFFGWVLIYCLVLVQETTRYRGAALILGILPYFAALAFFRGDVGTDTGSMRSCEWRNGTPFRAGNRVDPSPGFG